VAVATLGFAAPAVAAPMELTVDRLSDPAGPGTCDEPTADDCSLRQAVAIANANTGEADFIEFHASLTGTLMLTAAAGGQISITDAVYIYGNGPEETTVHAAEDSRIFHVDLTTANADVVIYSLTLTGGSLTEQSSASKGSAIWNWDADLHVGDSVVTGNTAVAGGAIYERSGDASTFVYSTFSGNDGGAILAPAGFGLIGGSTITGNTAARAPAVFVNSYPGGAIYDSTISGNHADDGGSQTGAVEMPYPLLFNTIVSDTSGPGVVDVRSSYAYAVSSLIETSFVNEPIEGSGNIVGVDPQLGSLAMNGGDIPTLKPALSSPVVDAGFSTSSFDQRGFARVVDNPSAPNAPGGNGADIGAVELTLAEGPQPQAAPPTPVKKKKRKCKKKRRKQSAASAKKKCKKKKKKGRSAVARADLRSDDPSWPVTARPFAVRD
jgi:hypothetical protein